MRSTPANRDLALLERFTEEPNRFGAYRIALGFPNSYEIGMSNLGFQWVYRLFNRVPDLVCERFFHEEGAPAVTFETRNAALGVRTARVVALVGNGHRQHPPHPFRRGDPAPARGA